MARKTKAEAEQTRHRIIGCARTVFNRSGVSNTSLEEVAKAAHVTRGAVYWHFKNKSDLFQAVRAQTGRLLKLNSSSTGDALQRLESGLLNALHRLQSEPEARSTYEVMLWKCEYVGEFTEVRNDLMKSGQDFLDEVTALYSEAHKNKIVSPDLVPEIAGLETFFFFTGLLKIWLTTQSHSVIQRHTAAAIKSHIASKRSKIISHKKPRQ